MDYIPLPSLLLQCLESDDDEISDILDLVENNTSDEEFDEIIKNYLYKEKIKRPKVRNYLETVTEYSDDEFKRNFRLSRRMYGILRQLFHDSDFNIVSEHGLPSTDVDTHILSFLWFAGNKCVIRDVAARFNIAESTFHKISTRIINFLNHISPQFIKFPRSEEEKEVVCNEFEQISGFTGTIGAIDGTYIPIRTPAHKRRNEYVNRHKNISITLQGICDAKKKFLDAFTGISSKVHDSRVYSTSFISEDLPNICEDRWHILGDGAYTLRKWMITPYRDNGRLTDQQKNFNHHLSKSRVRIENAFGLLKCRFRQLQKTEFLHVEKICKFIIACCVLHNMCIINDDLWHEEYIERNNANNNNEEHEFLNDRQAAAAGIEKRDRLSRELPVL